MQLLIVLHDNEEVLHEEFRFKFDNETTLDQLFEEIHSCFHIIEKFQKLYFADGQKISCVFPTEETLLKIGLKNQDKIIVKHASLPLWVSFLEGANRFKETYYEELKKQLYDEFQKLKKLLNDTNFFIAYPSHTGKRDKIDKSYNNYYDRTRGQIENSAKKYFQNLYRGSDPIIKFGSRSEGSRRGCICFVEVNGTTVKYHIKTHHGGGARDSHTREDLDLKELLAYKILERLGIGAVIHFVPNEIGSRWILYIASREIISFRTISEIESNEAEILSKYTKAVVQMLFIYTVLNMADHHSSNMGVDENDYPYIVDFFLIGRRSFDVKNDFYDKVRDAEKISKVLGTLQEKVQIAKEYLKKSDFVNNVDETLDWFLNESKTIFDQNHTVFKDEKKTEDLKLYVNEIKKNALKFKEFQL